MVFDESIQQFSAEKEMFGNPLVMLIFQPLILEGTDDKYNECLTTRGMGASDKFVDVYKSKS